MPSQLDRLVRVVSVLRSPKGCPWDRKQTHRSLIKYLTEESRELAAALRKGRWHEIEDELGDVLLQILLHAEIAKEAGFFDIQDVARSQALKLKRRHPHVFGDKKYKTPAQVMRHWKNIKAGERRLRQDDLRRRAR